MEAHQIRRSRERREARKREERERLERRKAQRDADVKAFYDRAFGKK